MTSILHQMAEEISRPLCEANKVTMVSSGGGEVGAAKLSGEVLEIMTRLPKAVEKLTGVNISQVTHSPGSFFFFCVTVAPWRSHRLLTGYFLPGVFSNRLKGIRSMSFLVDLFSVCLDSLHRNVCFLTSDLLCCCFPPLVCY